MVTYLIENVLTSVQYTVTESEWSNLISMGFSKKFKVVQKIEPKPVKVPLEIEHIKPKKQKDD